MSRITNISSVGDAPNREKFTHKRRKNAKVTNKKKGFDRRRKLDRKLKRNRQA